MNKFLDMHNIPRLNQEEVQDRNSPNTRSEIESVIEEIANEPRPEPDGVTGDFHQTISEELTLNLLKLF